MNAHDRSKLFKAFVASVAGTAATAGGKQLGNYAVKQGVKGMRYLKGKHRRVPAPAGGISLRRGKRSGGKGRRKKAKYSTAYSSSVRKAAYGGKDVKLPKTQRTKVKVGSKFKKMVKVAMEQEQSVGVYTDYVGGFIPNGGIDNLQQVCISLTNGDGSAGLPNTNLDLFSPNRILDVASVLFNSKLRGQYNVVTNNLLFDQSKIDIDYCSAQFTIRNNTQSARHISFYECVPKSHSATNAYQDWVSFLSQEYTDGINLSTALVPTIATSTLVTTYGATPSTTHKFGTKWKYAVREILLEPGQMQQFTVAGPRNFVYDYSKFYINTAACEWPRNIGKSCFFISRPVEPTPFAGASAAATNVGYNNQIANPVAGQLAFGVACVIRTTYKMMCPELAPVANRKTYVYSFNQTLLTSSNANVARVDVLQPAIVENTAFIHGSGTGPQTGI